MELTNQQWELLYSVASTGWHTDKGMTPAYAKECVIAGLLTIRSEKYYDYFLLMEPGINMLKSKTVRALQIDIQGQGPYILRGVQELARDIGGGGLEDILSNELDEKFGGDDGKLLFGVSIKKMSMWELANLDEWEPV